MDIKPAHPTIGVLLNQFEGEYQSFVWSGVNDFLKDRNANVVFFVGRALNPPQDIPSFHNMVYRMVNVNHLDGLIIGTGSIGNYSSTEELMDFLQPYRSIPIVSIGRVLEGIPSVIADNKSDIKNVISHLIEVHQYQEIAFVRGTEKNPDAEERYISYLEALNEHNILFDPEFVFPGNLTYESGIKAAHFFLNKKGKKPRAIVCANDEMAVAIFKTFQSLGIQIPQEIAVVGYDSIKAGNFLASPLTTINQFPYEQGRKGAEILMDIVEGNAIPEVFTFPTQLVIKESCGCVDSYPWKKKKQNSASLESDILEMENCASLTDKILENFDFTEEKNGEIKEALTVLIPNFIQDIKEQNVKGDFLRLLNQILSKKIGSGKNASIWQDILSVIRDSFISQIKNLPLKAIAEDICHQAQIFVGKFMEREEAYSNQEMNQLLWDFRDITLQVNYNYDLKKIMKMVLENFPRLGIKECYICSYVKGKFYKEQNNDNLPQNSELIMGYDEKGNVFSSFNTKMFFTSHLLPEVIISKKERYSFIIQPLCSREYQFGYILYQLGNTPSIIHEILREQISSVLEKSSFFEELKKGKEKLEATLEELSRSEERFREMAILFPTIVAETDIEMQFLFLNQAGMESFEILENSINNLSLLDYVYPEDKENLREYLARIMKGDLSDFNEFRFTKKNGSILTFLCKAYPINKNDSIEGIRWSIIDLKPMLRSIILPQELFFKEHKLSPREREVLTLILQGYKIKEIAKQLFISDVTVKVHSRSIYEKTGVQNKATLFEKLKDYQISRFGHQSFVFSLLSRAIQE